MLIKSKAFITFAQIFKSNANGIRCRSISSSASAAAPNPLLVNYLVTSLGFTREEAITASAKVKRKETTSAKVISKRSKNPDLVLNFLKQTGFDHAQMKKLVSNVPELLYYNVNTSIKPKFQWLHQELGLSLSDLVIVLTKNKTVFERRLDTHLRPIVECIRTVLSSNENLVKVLKRNSWLLTFGTQKTMKANLLLMRKFGMSDEQIKKLVLKRPGYIAENSDKVMDLLHRVENDFGIPRASAMFVYGVEVLFTVNKTKLERKMKILKCFGWSDSDVFTLFSKMPTCFNQSEARLEKVLCFFMNELGYRPAYLASHPSILNYNLDERVVPRLQVLRILEREKLCKRRVTLYGALTFSEPKFVKNYVLPYKDQIPDLYDSPKKTVSQ